MFDIDFGEVSEWFKVHAWNACVRSNVPGVRIPPSPLNSILLNLMGLAFGQARCFRSLLNSPPSNQLPKQTVHESMITSFPAR